MLRAVVVVLSILWAPGLVDGDAIVVRLLGLLVVILAAVLVRFIGHVELTKGGNERRNPKETQGAIFGIVPAVLISSSCFICSGCMIQQSATRQQMTHEFIEGLPNHPKTEVYNRVVRWVANNLKSEQVVSGNQDNASGSIVRNCKTEITPEGSWVNLKMGFTMTVDVKDEKMRVRFTNLRRVYGSLKYEEPLNDDFFTTPTAIPCQQAAHRQFADLVRSLADFIKGETVNAEDVYAPLSNR